MCLFVCVCVCVCAVCVCVCVCAHVCVSLFDRASTQYPEHFMSRALRQTTAICTGVCNHIKERHLATQTALKHQTAPDLSEWKQEPAGNGECVCVP